ncbi:stage V sporulation protein AC [Clostridia bacterium]|nr:stage V sporulation protein AC [Clostridia bacterium]
MDVSKKEYSKMAEKASPNSTIIVNCIKAFAVGGSICTLGQFLFDIYRYAGIDLKVSRILTSVTLVFLGALLTVMGGYNNIAKHAGAGSLVPITGFANAVVSPALEFKSEGLIAGTGVKMFVIAGPVLVYGILASVIYGLIYYAYTIFFS